jgi:probable F420-dependent oxidoreductase
MAPSTRPAVRFKVGLDLHPQNCTIEQLRAAWKAADELGVDTIWTWDHFFPLPAGRMVAPAIDPGTDGNHFEGWSLLAAMAVDTSRAHLGTLVTCNGYRNPDLLADMARTVDQLSGGRLILGLGAGWSERDYTEYGYDYGTPATRLKALGESLVRIKARLQKLKPGPEGPLPILVGGGGERVTLRLVAQYADMWNAFSPLETWVRKNGILDAWCAKVGRDPTAIERTIGILQSEADEWEAFVNAGASHIILMHPPPFDLSAARFLLDAARA